jgi:hypothetical protein
MNLLTYVRINIRSLCLPLRKPRRPTKFLMSVIFPLLFRPLRLRHPSRPPFSKALRPSLCWRCR